MPEYAYICPTCKGFLRKHDGPWALLHCLTCQKSIDLWYEPEPERVEIETAPEPYNPHNDAVVIVFDKTNGQK